MTFLFATALLALPLAALPVLLHLLFRRKSPVVLFPTLRFVKIAVQHTAARRKIQRWLLLACRVLLLLLLVLAIAQPARQLASAWAGTGQSAAAVIVVDTSYSMLLQQDGKTTLLDRADAMIQELLRDQLKNARVAILRSLPPASQNAEPFREVGAIQKDWTGLKPQPNPLPLARRIETATEMLTADPASQKWLFIITDLQSREFSQPIQTPPEVKTVLLDLHPDEARSAGITSVKLEPEDPLPGIGSEAVVEVAGRAGDSRAVTLSVAKAEEPEKILVKRPAQVASFDSGGRSQVRFPVRLPAERFLLVKGTLQAPDALPWDNERTQLVEVPPRRAVTLLEQSPQLPANKFLRLALDASEGTQKEWPLMLTRGASLTGKEAVAAINLTQWPDAAEAKRLADFVRGGGTLIVFLQPGLEESFKSADGAAKQSMLELLPASPGSTPNSGGAYRAGLATMNDPLMKGLTDKKFDIGGIIVRRFVPLTEIEGRDVAAILNLSEVNPRAGSRTYPLLARRKLGSGMVYTLATLPQPLYTNLPTHPLFLPLVVRMSLRAAGRHEARNVELGSPLVLANSELSGVNELEIETSAHERSIVKASAAHEFIFEGAATPGVYVWRDGTKEVAMSNVQLPSGEADLTYRDAKTILTPTDTHLIARSLADLKELLARASEPEPEWGLPIAIVMLLLCLEALMGSKGRMRGIGAWGSAPAEAA